MHLDCRDLPCPSPVKMTKQALDSVKSGKLTILVNTDSSIINVKRFLTYSTITFTEVQKEGYIELLGVLNPLPQERTFWSIMVSAVVLAFLSTSCCLTPLIFLVFGTTFSSLSLFTLLAPFQYLLTAVALIALIYLWLHYFLVVQKRKVCQGTICKSYIRYLIAGSTIILIFISYPLWIVSWVG